MPSADDQRRLKAEWLQICQKIGASPSTFRLEFGERFDCGFCILRCGDGWMVLDILRGNEESRRFLPSDDDLLYESAKTATFAMAGWDREKNESSFSRALGTLFHYIDPKLDTRLQGRQQLRQVQRRQLRLMKKIGPAWARRLTSDHQLGRELIKD
jgi:hypothetical protein